MWVVGVFCYLHAMLLIIFEKRKMVESVSVFVSCCYDIQLVIDVVQCEEMLEIHLWTKACASFREHWGLVSDYRLLFINEAFFHYDRSCACPELLRIHLWAKFWASFCKSLCLGAVVHWWIDQTWAVSFHVNINRKSSKRSGKVKLLLHNIIRLYIQSSLLFIPTDM